MDKYNNTCVIKEFLSSWFFFYIWWRKNYEKIHSKNGAKVRLEARNVNDHDNRIHLITLFSHPGPFIIKSTRKSLCLSKGLKSLGKAQKIFTPFIEPFLLNVRPLGKKILALQWSCLEGVLNWKIFVPNKIQNFLSLKYFPL